MYTKYTSLGKKRNLRKILKIYTQALFASLVYTKYTPLGKKRNLHKILKIYTNHL